MNEKNIYLVFSNTGTILSKCIYLYTKDKYVHVSISFDDSFDKMYSFGRIYPSIPFIGGFVQENLKDGVYKKFENSKCVIYKVTISNHQYNLLKKELNEFINSEKRYGYNLIGLFGVVLQRPIKRNNRYFCSEFVSQLLINSNIYNSNKCPSLIKPSDLLEITQKEFVYEGLTNDYRNTIEELIS
ncbi:hypothetical protein [Clostridium tertium]|uniref:Permuted papain-like amidase enzyme, YaeF/YiiX, C92 family n=1 Tax=Clostridium tertium TaxID=1559 RepID=A0A6N3BA21_9CLOT